MARLSKYIRKTLRAGIMTFLAGLSCACGQDMVNSGTMPEAMCFSVTTGNSVELTTKSPSDPEDTTDLLQPLVLRADGLDMPLYLHTYVRDREDSEETLATKSTPVKDDVTFKEVNGENGFGLTAFFPNGKGTHIPAYSAVKPRSEGSVWSTTPLYYWPPASNKLRFFAFAPVSVAAVTEPVEVTVPSSVTNLVVEDNKATFNFKTPSGTNGNDAESQPDLMFATNICDRAGSENGTVPMNFRHALSAIKFAIRDVVDGTIESISIKGVAGSGKCVYDFSTGGFSWSDYGDTESSYSQTFGYTVADVTYTPTGESSDVVLNDKMPKKTFMLIPQDIPEDAKIEVVFIRKDGKTFTMSGKINDNIVTRWEPGKEYVYTISTSSSNWIYYFDVIGCEQAPNDDEPSKGKFSDKSGKIVVNQTVTEGAYYKVISYKERANNPEIKEPVPWTAEVSEGTTSIPDEISSKSEEIKNYFNNINGKKSDARAWMPEDGTNNIWEGNGSVKATKYDVSFAPQMTGTSWPGDWQMRSKNEVGKEAPRDLSKVAGTRNTANCYVVNAPGYYKLPLVYGNAITDDRTNERSYKFNNGDVDNCNGKALGIFKDYNGNEIKNAKISGAKSAILVWQDAYNLISDVKLEYGTDGYDYLTFKVNGDELQQGNAVLGIRDRDNTIMWSWHIWINEEWIKNDEGILGNRDVKFDTWDSGYDQFTSARHNLGWCDPKDVWYLKRTGTMTFTQKQSGKEKTLNVEQRECKIEYWIGNNVYYQFGRKDPIVGFMNEKSVVKYNFGTLAYKIEDQFKNIQDGIRNPNILYLGKNITYGTGKEHWLNTNYYNLWNNTSIALRRPNGNYDNADFIKYLYSGVKTIYDPSPAGYMVPPGGFFKIMVNAQRKASGIAQQEIGNFFNGYYKGMSGHNGYYIYTVYTQKGKRGETMDLTGTGERWYRRDTAEPGSNFNPATIYLWSNQIIPTANGGTRSGAGLALGGGASHYYFIGAAAMARPVRPVREFTR